MEVCGAECAEMECVRECGGTEKSKRASESDSEKAEGREREVGRDERRERGKRTVATPSCVESVSIASLKLKDI